MSSVILLLLTLAGHQDYSPACVWHSPAKVAHVGRVLFIGSLMGVIYEARCKVNGKPYVGQTTKMMNRRRKEHERDAEYGSECVFHRALRKYGFDAFEWKVIARDNNPDE